MSKTAELFRTGLVYLAHSDLEGYLTLFSDDVDFEFPFAPADRPTRIHGRENLRDYLEPILSMGTLDTVTHLEIFETNAKGTIVVEMTLDLRPVGSSVVLSRNYIAVVTAAGGYIVSYRDYWNPNWTAEQAGASSAT